MKKKQLSLFPGYCQVCGVKEDKFAYCDKCETIWKKKNLEKDEE